MLQEEWTRWEPSSGLLPKYDIISLIDDPESFRMLLGPYSATGPDVLVTFEMSVDAYRSADETLRLQLVYDLKEKYGSDFYGQWTFFKVNNSAYLRWTIEQSCSLADGRDYMHFSFVAGNCVVDVIDNCEPKIEFIERNRPW